MADGTSIEWTEATWNPITGCSVTSPGCTNCYAMKLAGTRLAHHDSRAGLTIATKAGPVWNGQVKLNEQWLDQPLRWTRPRMIFVCAHGDLFHESVPDAWIDRVFAVMALCPQHTFQVLTKRSARMREYLGRACGRIADRVIALRRERGEDMCGVIPLPHVRPGAAWWPLANIWLGVSVEDQQRADERVPDLLATPAAVRWISAEPLLGQVDLTMIPNGEWIGDDQLCEDALRGAPDCQSGERLDWIVTGGESGPGARPMHPQWARSLRDQCAAAGVPFFFKQWGAWAPLTKARPAECGLAAWPDGTVGSGSADRNGGLGEAMFIATKKIAGRLLDGQSHDAMPQVVAHG